MLYTKEQIASMRRTARKSGAVGRNSRVPAVLLRLLDDFPNITLEVVDYGCGYGQHLEQVAAHRCVEHVRGVDLEPDGSTCVVAVDGTRRLYERADDGRASIVYASNVLNVQHDRASVQRLVQGMCDAGVDGAWLLMNYPESPRKWNLKAAEMREVLQDAMAREYGCEVAIERVGGTFAAPVWLLRPAWPGGIL